MTRTARLGVFGGTFDPVHVGHLEAAEIARRALQLDEVLLMPARQAPHRSTPPHASAFHRFAMLALATLRYRSLRPSDLELCAPGPSYTSLTLQRLAATGLAPAQLFFIAGADAFAEITTWYDYPALLDRSHFVILTRPGHPVGALRDALPTLAARMIDLGNRQRLVVPDGPPLGIFLLDARTPAVSSTLVRERVIRGDELTGLVTPEVAAYIHRQGLYRPDRAPGDLAP
jgi:nicotinate-nucleotide adenylyltransferase